VENFAKFLSLRARWTKVNRGCIQIKPTHYLDDARINRLPIGRIIRLGPFTDQNAH